MSDTPGCCPNCGEAGDPGHHWLEQWDEDENGNRIGDTPRYAMFVCFGADDDHGRS